ncbi:MAG: hypothetical protein LBK99_00365 [Opitutaceae bacterium]|nr:hypothetical protein [Opitutaceae bacterium]
MKTTTFLLTLLACVPSLFADADSIASETRAKTTFDMRRDRLVEAAIGLAPGGLRRGATPPPPTSNDNVFGARAVTLLRLGLHAPAANQELRTICAQIGKPRGRSNAVIDSGFTGIELARAYLALRDSPLLEESTREAIRHVFRTYSFEPNRESRSENHYLVFWVCRFLMTQELPGTFFDVYGKTGAELAREDALRLKQFIRYRARQGWGEFDSNSYLFLSFNLILALHDFSRDEELVRLSGMMANLMLADMAVDTISGLYGGARARVYEPLVLDRAASHGRPAMKDTNDLQYLYFGIADPEPQEGRERLLRLQGTNYWDRGNESLFSTFRPLEIVSRIMLERPAPYESRERKHLHNMEDPLPVRPLSGSIRKQTLYHPGRYLLGSIQYQDAYPADTPGDGASYAGHQQVEWSFTIPVGTATHIFTHHPGISPMHSYWRGMHRCRCTSTFQHRTAHLAVFDIPAGQKYQFVHAFFPRAAFAEIVEASPWIFARQGGVFVALYLSDGYEWTKTGEWKNVELVSKGSRKASILETGLPEDVGTFDAFRREILANPVRFDRETMRLTYESKRAGLISIDSNGTREVDGKAVDLDYPLYESPYIRSAWDSGIVYLAHGPLRVRLDFNTATTQYP